MTATTSRARWMSNNFIGADIVIRATSEAIGFPVENIYHPARSKPWRSAGYYEITAANCTLYFNDGSARTATLNTGGYTASQLETELAAAVVRSGASATVALDDYSTAPKVWRLTFSTSVTLSLSNASNAIWDTLGFTGSTDRVATVFVADAARAHSYEQLTFNLGVERTPSFFALTCAVDEVCRLSSSAVVTLMASNIDEWTAPPKSITLTRTDFGVKEWLDSQTLLGREYFALRIVDRENPLGSAGIEIGHLYLGDHVTTTTSNVGVGWRKKWMDPSTSQKSIDGTKYSLLRPKYRSFTGVGVGNVSADERDDLEQTFFDLGTTVPFYASLDPGLEVSASIDELTFYGYLVDFELQHVIRDYYSISLALEEAV